MKKLIDPGTAPIIEHYCDGCGELVIIEGLPADEVPETHKEFSVALSGSFCYSSSVPGLFFDMNLCETCGLRLVKLMEKEFSIKIESPLIEGGEE